MKNRPRSARRSVTGGLVLAAGLAGLAVVAPSGAHAADTDATFSWSFAAYSTQASSQLYATSATDGASIGSDKVITFTGGDGETHTGTGATDVQYDGTVAFGNAYNSYSITFADPEVKIDDAGNGEVDAHVTVKIGSAEASDLGVLPVVTFDADYTDWTGTSLTATPDWAGVAADGAYGTAGKPVNGESWDPTFVTALPSSVRAFYYASGSASDELKAPAELTAVAPTAVPPQVSYQTTSASYADGLTLSVDGTGFRGVTKPGDAGVYVGLAPSGGLPDVSSQQGMASFAGAQWVPAASIADGSFSTTLTAPADALDPATSYSLYTWQAHAHSTTTQDSETPVTIDWSTLAVPAADLELSGPTSKKYGAAATLTVKADVEAGTVHVTGLGKALDARLSSGTVKVTVPKTLAVGSHKVTVSYAGDASHSASTTSRTLKVTKAAAKVKTAWKRKVTHHKAGQLTVTVAGVSGAAKPGGKVSATLTSGKRRVSVVAKALRNGTVALTVPKLAAGSWKVTVHYQGDASYGAAAATRSLRLKR